MSDPSMGPQSASRHVQRIAARTILRFGGSGNGGDAAVAYIMTGEQPPAANNLLRHTFDIDVDVEMC